MTLAEIKITTPEETTEHTISNGKDGAPNALSLSNLGLPDITHDSSDICGQVHFGDNIIPEGTVDRFVQGSLEIEIVHHRQFPISL